MKTFFKFVYLCIVYIITVKIVHNNALNLALKPKLQHRIHFPPQPRKEAHHKTNPRHADHIQVIHMLPDHPTYKHNFEPELMAAPQGTKKTIRTGTPVAYRKATTIYTEPPETPSTPSTTTAKTTTTSPPTTSTTPTTEHRVRTTYPGQTFNFLSSEDYEEARFLRSKYQFLRPNFTTQHIAELHDMEKIIPTDVKTSVTTVSASDSSSESSSDSSSDYESSSEEDYKPVKKHVKVKDSTDSDSDKSSDESSEYYDSYDSDNSTTTQEPSYESIDIREIVNLTSREEAIWKANRSHILKKMYPSAELLRIDNNTSEEKIKYYFTVTDIDKKYYPFYKWYYNMSNDVDRMRKAYNWSLVEDLDFANLSSFTPYPIPDSYKRYFVFMNFVEREMKREAEEAMQEKKQEKEWEDLLEQKSTEVEEVTPNWGGVDEEPVDEEHAEKIAVEKEGIDEDFEALESRPAASPEEFLKYVPAVPVDSKGSLQLGGRKKYADSGADDEENAEKSGVGDVMMVESFGLPDIPEEKFNIFGKSKIPDGTETPLTFDFGFTKKTQKTEHETMETHTSTTTRKTTTVMNYNHLWQSGEKKAPSKQQTHTTKEHSTKDNTEHPTTHADHKHTTATEKHIDEKEHETTTLKQDQSHTIDTQKHVPKEEHKHTTGLEHTHSAVHQDHKSTSRIANHTIKADHQHIITKDQYKHEVVKDEHTRTQHQQTTKKEEQTHIAIEESHTKKEQPHTTHKIEHTKKEDLKQTTAKKEETHSTIKDTHLTIKETLTTKVDKHPTTKETHTIKETIHSTVKETPTTKDDKHPTTKAEHEHTTAKDDHKHTLTKEHQTKKEEHKHVTDKQTTVKVHEDVTKAQHPQSTNDHIHPSAKDYTHGDQKTTIHEKLVKTSKSLHESTTHHAGIPTKEAKPKDLTTTHQGTQTSDKPTPMKS